MLTQVGPGGWGEWPFLTANVTNAIEESDVFFLLPSLLIFLVVCEQRRRMLKKKTFPIRQYYFVALRSNASSKQAAVATSRRLQKMKTQELYFEKGKQSI